MGFPKKRNIFNIFIFPAAVFAFALVILFVSLSLAGLETVSIQPRHYRVVPIDFAINPNGVIKVDSSYKLPPVDTLPTNPFYGFKRLRDYIWISFSNGPVKKSQITLLLADKKMAESIALYKTKQTEAGLEASREALNKLEYADKLISDFNPQKKDIQKDQIKAQIRQTGLAYKEIMISVRKNFGLDNQGYQQLITDLNNWNEEKQKEEIKN